MEIFVWLFFFLDRQQFCTWWCSLLTVVVLSFRGDNGIQGRFDPASRITIHKTVVEHLTSKFQFVAHLIIKTDVLKLEFYSMV